MNTEKLTQLEQEIEKNELLEEFQMEELEQRFEMTAAIEDGNPKEGQGWTILTIEF